MIGDKYITSPLMSYVRCRGTIRQALDIAKSRLIVAGFTFTLLFICITFRLCDITLFQSDEKYTIDIEQTAGLQTARANIVDRHGEILATTIVTGSLYANAKVIHNVEDVAQKLLSILEINKSDLIKRLSSGRRFIWLARHLSPKQQVEIIKLGIPGIDIIRDERRIYPQGPLTAHLVGMTDPDKQGIAGAELTLDQVLRTSAEDVRLSIDLNLQNALYDELEKGMIEFKARSVNGIIIHIPTGEILGMASLPAFNPNIPKQVDYNNLFDRNVAGVYELGSILKLVNTALALEESKVSIHKKYDATKPIKIGRFCIKDLHPRNQWMSVSDIFRFSSNIGSGQMALEAGIDTQKAFLKRIGLLNPVSIELPGAAKPIYPRHWNESSAFTISYGYGISVTPLVFAVTTGSLLTGFQIKPTLLYQGNKGKKFTTQIISPQTSANLRALMRLNVTQGSGKKADIPGYVIAGKTGTAMQRVNGKYQDGILTTSFVATFGKTLNNPEYLVQVTYDRPQNTEKTYGYRTAGWNACVTAGNVMKRMVAILSLKPSFSTDIDRDHDINTLVKLASLEG